MMTTLKEEHLKNGLQIVFVDESNRYFGDYHRICVLVTIIFNLSDLTIENADDETFQSRAIEVIGEKLLITKRIERMGVASVDVAQVRDDMIESFLQHSSSYLARSGYPRSLVAAELNKPRTHRFYG